MPILNRNEHTDTLEYVRIPVRSAEDRQLMLLSTEWSRALMQHLLKAEEGTPHVETAKAGENFLILNAASASPGPMFGALAVEVRRTANKIQMLGATNLAGKPLDLSPLRTGTPTKPERALSTAPHEALSEEELKKATFKDVAALIRRDVLRNPWLYFVVRSILSTVKNWDESRGVEGHMTMIGTDLAQMVMPVIRAAALDGKHEKNPATVALLESWTKERSLASSWAKNILSEAAKIEE